MLLSKLHSSPPRLLIADDDCALRETVVEILQPYFQTIAVPSGEAAIEVVESREIDVALFDLHMRELSGLDVIRRVHQLFADLPCILMSADVTSAVEQEARALETFSVLRKPLTRQQLLDTIHCALEL